MTQSQNNQIRARRGALALLRATEGEIDPDFVGLAVRDLIIHLGHYCDSQGLPFRRINKGALRDWEQQRASEE